jgi:hypothetical protein
VRPLRESTDSTDGQPTRDANERCIKYTAAALMCASLSQCGDHSSAVLDWSSLPRRPVTVADERITQRVKEESMFSQNVDYGCSTLSGSSSFCVSCWCDCSPRSSAAMPLLSYAVVSGRWSSKLTLLHATSQRALWPCSSMLAVECSTFTAAAVVAPSPQPRTVSRTSRCRRCTKTSDEVVSWRKASLLTLMMR